MEMAGCILLLPNFFLHLLSTYIDLPHCRSLNQSLSCFLQLVPSISSSVGPIYFLHPLHVLLSSSKHLFQVVSKHDHTTSHHSPLPVYLLLPSIPTCLSAPLYSFCPPTLLARPLTIDLSALLKIATSFFLKHHVSLPYNIADLLYTFPFIRNENLFSEQYLTALYISCIPLLFLQSLRLHIHHWHSTYRQESKIPSQFPLHHTLSFVALLWHHLLLYYIYY